MTNVVCVWLVSCVCVNVWHMLVHDSNKSVYAYIEAQAGKRQNVYAYVYVFGHADLYLWVYDAYNVCTRLVTSAYVRICSDVPIHMQWYGLLGVQEWIFLLCMYVL